MKKLLSVALVASLALSGMNMQAGDKVKKTWAYCKIVGGCLAIPGNLLFSLAFIGNYKTKGDANNNRLLLIKSVITASSFSVLSIQSGLRDLKKIKKKENKQKVLV